MTMSTNQSQVVTTGVDVEETTYERTWNIRNFDLILKSEELIANQQFTIETGQDVSSGCTFLVGLHKETSAKKEEYIALSCTLLKAKGILGKSIGVKVLLRIDNVAVGSQSKKLKQWESIVFRVFSTVACLSGDGSVSFNIKLTLARHAVSTNLDHRQQLNQRSALMLQDNLIKLLSDGDTSDIKIVTSDGMEFLAHKTILQMQNKVFATLLRSDFAESRTGVVNVDDICGKTMELILRYIYTGHLLKDWSHPDIVVEFVYAAEKYNLTEVLKMLDDTLGDNSSHEYTSCYISLLTLANKLSLKKAVARLTLQVSKLSARADTVEEMISVLKLT